MFFALVPRICRPSSAIAKVRATGARVPARIGRWSEAGSSSARSSIWIGAISHVLFDFVSHETFVLLLPWHAYARVFPSFWYARWFELRTPFYKEPYPIGPHFTVWLVLSVVGAVMFFSGSARAEGRAS